MARDNGEAPGAAGPDVPMLASMRIMIYADGSIAYEAPLSNLPVCFTMVGMMQAELNVLQWQRTRRQAGGIVLGSAGDVPSRGPQGVDG